MIQSLETQQMRRWCQASWGRTHGAAVGLLLLALGACGGSEPGAVTPDAEVAQNKPKAVAKGAGKARVPAMNASAQAAYQAGVEAFRSGNLKAAEQNFRKAAAADPSAPAPQLALGTTLERTGTNEDALAVYKRCVDSFPTFAPGIEAMTRVYLAASRPGDAESALNRLRSKNGDTAAILASLAEVKSVQKDSAEAQRLAQAALKADPDYRPAMAVLARDHYRNRRLDLALYTLTAILDGYGSENPPRDKDNAEARLLRGLIYKEQGLRKPAIDELRRSIELRPDFVEARLDLAAFMLEAGNAQEAVPLLEGALPYEAANVLVHLNLGDAYRLQGRPVEAIKQLSWVVQADSKLAQAHYNLGLVYLFSANIEGVSADDAIQKAIAEFETYQKMQPRTRAGAGDDAAELLARAKNKKAVQDAMKVKPGAEGKEGFDDF